MTLVTKGAFVGDTENLPKWAQDYIELLQNRADRATEELTKLRAERLYSKDGSMIAVPDGKIVIWRGALTTSYDRIEAVFGKDGTLDVRGMHLGIEPMAGNRVVLHPGKFH